MAAIETAARRGRAASYSETRLARGDETKNALKTTEFFAMVAVNATILIAAWVSDTLDDGRAWTLVAAVAIGYMISRGLAKSSSKYVGGEDPSTAATTGSWDVEAVPRRSPRHSPSLPTRRSSSFIQKSRGCTAPRPFWDSSLMRAAGASTRRAGVTRLGFLHR
jgi:hypothetical protein